MKARVPRVSLTPEDLAEMPDENAYELIDGNLVERDAGAESGAIAAQIIFLLGSFLKRHRLGRVFSSEDDTISGEDVLPGFTSAVKEFFVNGNFA
jgi:Uma2 family endonuclease